jgi:putative glutamine amidotransferase
MRLNDENRKLRLGKLDTTRAFDETDGHIVISGMWPRDRSRPRVPIPFVHAVEKAGGSPYVMSAFPLAPGEKAHAGLPVDTNIDPEDAVLPAGAAGLVLTGGGDVDPAIYGQRRHPRTYNISLRRDRFELNLLRQALERDLPVLAICRGMQVLNVHLGGTLEQHIADSPDRLDHDRDRTRAEPAHDIDLDGDSVLTDVLEAARLPVNSHHHQGLGEVAEPLQEVGWADDGVLEAVVSRDHTWVVGVQWHPEAMAPVSARQAKLFEGLVAVSGSAGRDSHARARSA